MICLILCSAPKIRRDWLLNDPSGLNPAVKIAVIGGTQLPAGESCFLDMEQKLATSINSVNISVVPFRDVLRKFQSPTADIPYSFEEDPEIKAKAAGTDRPSVKSDTAISSQLNKTMQLDSSLTQRLKNALTIDVVFVFWLPSCGSDYTDILAAKLFSVSDGRLIASFRTQRSHADPYNKELIVSEMANEAAAGLLRIMK
jgi:hypothetical protein